MNIIESLKKEPEKWIQTECTLKHKSGTAIWTGNGIFFINTFPSHDLSPCCIYGKYPRLYFCTNI